MSNFSKETKLDTSNCIKPFAIQWYSTYFQLESLSHSSICVCPCTFPTYRTHKQTSKQANKQTKRNTAGSLSFDLLTKNSLSHHLYSMFLHDICRFNMKWSPIRKMVVNGMKWASTLPLNNNVEKKLTGKKRGKLSCISPFGWLCVVNIQYSYAHNAATSRKFVTETIKKKNQKRTIFHVKIMPIMRSVCS